MTEHFSVLVPYRPDGGWRQRAWGWLSERWWRMAPGAEVVVEGDDGGAHPGEFNHPAAINRAAARARHDVFIIADADTGFSPAWVEKAVDLVRAGVFPWILPQHYDKLTKAATEDLLKRNPTASLDGEDLALEWQGTGINWSGLVVVYRADFERVGGYDERFSWWGADDIAFGLTQDALVGKHFRLPGTATHLWHPAPQEETYGHEQHARQDRLMRCYIAAAEDAEALREVRFG